MRNNRRLLCARFVFFASIFAVSGCTQIVESRGVDNSMALAPTPARYTWMLPKTIVSVSVVYTLTDCSDQTGKVTISPTVTISNVSEPDVDLGSDFPNGMVSIEPEQLRAFWQDNNVTVKTNQSTHILSYLGSQPSDQTATIVGSLITTATKLTAVAFGVPVAAAPAIAAKYCGSANAVLKKVKDLQAQLVDPAVTADSIKNIPTQIASLQTALSITVQKKFDPGISPTPINPITGRSFIGNIRPTLNQLKQSNWFDNNAVAQSAYQSSKELRVDLYMDFEHAFPLNSVKDAVSCNSESRCHFSRVKVTEGTLFREVSYIPVLAFQASDQETPVLKKILPFGQFGTPRNLPIVARAFEQLTWSLTFLDSGELTEATFTSKARGTALSTLLGSAASGANSIATESRAAAVAMDPATTRLQNENAALKAQIDNATYTQQLHTLLAAGGR